MSYGKWEPVIGLEIHTQLATRTKLFCHCPTQVEGQSVSAVAPNELTCPLCAGHPGTLPVLNAEVPKLAARLGLATQSTIALKNVFARKNYFYADLPKGYQISQYELPICQSGQLTIGTGDESGSARTIHIERIHIEEDAGKSQHLGSRSLVNLNRAGVPLLEIVSAPELRSPAEAAEYMRTMHELVVHLGVSDGNLQEGNFRCDANVSVRLVGQAKLGTRTEIKNINSFRFVEKAIEFEIRRQIRALEAGEQIVQETRGYDADADRTFTMRTKENADDYRYFPDPDLMPVQLTEAFVEAVRREMPELPAAKRERYQKDFGLSPYDANVLVGDAELGGFFAAVMNSCKPTLGKTVSNLVTGEIARRVKGEECRVEWGKLSASAVAELAELIGENAISVTAAKQVLPKLFEVGGTATAWVDQLGLRQVSDEGSLLPIVEKIIAANPAQWTELCGGKDKLMGFFVGQVMKEMRGQGNPGLIQALLTRLMKRD